MISHCFIQCMLSSLFLSTSKSVIKVSCVFANDTLTVVWTNKVHFPSSPPVLLTLPGNADEELLFAKLVTERQWCEFWPAVFAQALAADLTQILMGICFCKVIVTNDLLKPSSCSAVWHPSGEQTVPPRFQSAPRLLTEQTLQIRVNILGVINQMVFTPTKFRLKHFESRVKINVFEDKSISSCWCVKVDQGNWWDSWSN